MPSASKTSVATPASKTSTPTRSACRSKVKESRVNAARKIALVTGVFFVMTFLTSISPALLLYGPVLNDPNYIVGAGAYTNVRWGVFLELLLAIANIGTAVTPFPIVKRQNESLALGYV